MCVCVCVCVRVCVCVCVCVRVRETCPDVESKRVVCPHRFIQCAHFSDEIQHLEVRFMSEHFYFIISMKPSGKECLPGSELTVKCK